MEPSSQELQLDLDGAAAVEQFQATWNLFAAHKITAGWKWVKAASRRRGCFHITVTMPHSRALPERICLQAVFGSDLKREAHNYVRYHNDSPMPVVFFEKMFEKSDRLVQP